MHRKILLGVLVLTIAASACLTSSHAEMAHGHPTTVRITTPTEGEAGSGVVIAPDWVLTCSHCLPCITADELPVRHQIAHPSLDLALLHVPGIRGAPITFAGQLPAVHDELASYGWHMGDFLLMTEGHAGEQLGMMSCPIIGGASGGPVVNSLGQLVGVNEALYAVAGFGGGVPIPHVSRYTVLDADAVEWIASKMQAHEEAIQPVEGGR